MNTQYPFKMTITNATQNIVTLNMLNIFEAIDPEFNSIISIQPGTKSIVNGFDPEIPRLKEKFDAVVIAAGATPGSIEGENVVYFTLEFA
jgi:hypothetical protein